MTMIAQISDLHLRPIGQPCYRVSETNMLAERAINSILALPQQPDAVVVTGDITDRADPREYALAREILGRLPMPVYVVPGNHDDTKRIRKGLKDLPGITASTSEEKLFYSKRIGGLQLIALDSSVPGKPYGLIGQTQMDWLSRTLKESKLPTIIAVHHPPVLTGLHFMDTIGLRDADEFAATLENHRHVERIMCGHVHRAVTASFAGTIVTLAPSTAHACTLNLSSQAPAYFHLEPPFYYLHALLDDGSIATHSAFVESYPGPYFFSSGEDKSPRARN